MLRRFSILSVTTLLFALGCRQESSVQVVEFEPNLVYSYQMGERSEQPFDQPLAEITVALDELFGTPGEPKLPAELQDGGDFEGLLSMENLLAASGDPEMEGRGLYRKHCATCHGVTGNGRGPTAALVDPYPRDYRMGTFKFKSTPIGSKPTKGDLAYAIEHGIVGSSMVKIPELTAPDIDALADYVIYLSMRGEVERSLLLLASDFDFTDPEYPESLYKPELAKGSEDDVELWEEQQEEVGDIVYDVVEGWADGLEAAVDVPARDKSLVPETFEEVLVAVAAEGDSPIKQSVARGQEWFVSEKTSCSKCHGKEGRGDGQTNDYDAWTKEWTAKFGVDPAVPEEHIPLIARGALPARKVSPRNFHEGVFRGGNTPEKLYQRIALGIEGTPMPAASVDKDAIWDLVNFVRSLYEPPAESEAAAENPANVEASAGGSDSVASL
ncbi:MAG: c-type cytochrome [Planctomycetota bacterium]